MLSKGEKMVMTYLRTMVLFLSGEDGSFLMATEVPPHRLRLLPSAISFPFSAMPTQAFSPRVR